MIVFLSEETIVWFTVWYTKCIYGEQVLSWHLSGQSVASYIKLWSELVDTCNKLLAKQTTVSYGWLVVVLFAAVVVIWN